MWVLLAAPKVTDSLVDCNPAHSGRTTTYAESGCKDTPTVLLTAGARAAVISAAFLIVNYVSRTILDIDPEEIEVLEPCSASKTAEQFRSAACRQVSQRCRPVRIGFARLAREGEAIIVDSMRVLINEGPIPACRDAGRQAQE